MKEVHISKGGEDMNRKSKNQPGESLWTVQTAADFLGYSDGTVRNLIGQGKLPRVKLPTGAIRIPSEAVKTFGYGAAQPRNSHPAR
jgi:excisionase family DNA binding protein